MLPYSEVDERIGYLLREFGPKRKVYHPEHPFWRLQNDGVWELSGAEQIQPSSGGNVNRGDLIRYDVSGGFTEEIAHQLRHDSDLAFEIVQNILYAHFPGSIHDDILQAVGIELTFKSIRRLKRPKCLKRDPNFRTNVLRAYENRCAVCGFDLRLRDHPIALEAAHIRWHMSGGPDKEENGLALCVLHHKLFDRGAFTLSKHLDILVSNDASGSAGFQDWLLRFHGQKLNLPQSQVFFPNENYTRWHVKEVFKGEFREL